MSAAEEHEARALSAILRGERAVANLAQAVGRGPDSHVVRDLIVELRWMTESRARWKAACENQGGARASDAAYQLRLLDEEVRP